MRDAGARRVKIDALIARERFNLRVLLQILRSDILNVVINREHRLRRIRDRCCADLSELRHHRAGVVVRHHMTRTNRDEIPRAHHGAGSKSISMACGNFFNKRQTHDHFSFCLGRRQFPRMALTSTIAATAWERGRFDARAGPCKLLFGRMYEDAAIELGAFRPGGRVFCIASAGCTAMQLAPHHEVVAVDINPIQFAYVEHRRGSVAPAIRVPPERFMAFARALGPLPGWWPARFAGSSTSTTRRRKWISWRRYLDTRRFRAAFDLLLSGPTSALDLRLFLTARFPRTFAMSKSTKSA